MSKLLNDKWMMMNKLRDKIECHILKAENHWKAFSVEKQKLLTKVFFAGYCFLTVIVLIHVIVETGQRGNSISIDHIDGISTKSLEKASEHHDFIESPIKK